MRRQGLLVFGILLIAFGAALNTAAQQTQTDAKPFAAPGKLGVSGLYNLIGPDTAGAQTGMIGMVADMSEFSLPEDPRTPQLLDFGITGAFSFTDNLEIGVLLPYRRLSLSDEAHLEGFEETGIGDIQATAKYRLLEETDRRPALGMFTTLSFPTGDEAKGLGSGAYDVTIGSAMTKHLGPVKLYGNIGYLVSGWEEGDPNPLFDNYENSLLYGVGLEFPAYHDRIRLFSELTFVHEFGDDVQIETFQGANLPDDVEDAGDDSTQDEDDDGAKGMINQNGGEDGDDGTGGDEEPEATDADTDLLVAAVDDPVDDSGQLTLGVTFQLTESLMLRGGAAFQILGDEPVPDAPDWRGFVNLSYRFGRPKRSSVADVEPLAEPPAEGEGEIVEQSLTDANQCPVITDVSVSDTVVGGGEQVRIAVTAQDADNDQLFFFWVASRGRLTGRESQVVWTAPTCQEIGNVTDTYDLTVEVSDGECTIDRLITISVNCGPGSPTAPSAGGRQAEAVILFPSGGAKLDNIAKAQLDTVATLLKQFPNQPIVLEGHADATGSADANQRIGLQRAESVKRYLVSRHGIDANRITTNSYGASRPIASNETPAGRKQNRRVEIYRGW
jgi:outer membrane protein OmpA-like peptidoglycan-associated protein